MLHVVSPVSLGPEEIDPPERRTDLLAFLRNAADVRSEAVPLVAKEVCQLLLR